ncbi:RHS repeat-associated core domain-containing protein [Curtobacterium sp. 9128]|uniref:beta strand repeat-containing protein n=1 Tax=Curtobacterium sp. 9128 TaxID=1793722 RepID=UPI0007D72913|nr:RHS repeat-associated core domain-containing protein [Curtobacterium sp. 9128]SBN63226.1 RHS repeat-associated core domain-containing protein [Curtobacterium sp. 9128]
MTAANTLKTIKVAGVNGLPTTDLGAVSLMITIGDPNGQGQVTGRPDANDPNTLLMIYGAGVGGNTSNTSLLAVGDDGNIRIATETAQAHVQVDVTGYYTSTENGAGAGGFVPINGTRIANTVNGTGVRQGQLHGGDAITFQAAGANGIPANAAAVAVSIIVQNSGGGAGWVRPFPTDGTKGTGMLNYVSTQGISTAMSAQVAVGTGGKLTIDTAAKGGTIDLQVDVQGYFLPSNPGGGFTPQTGRLIDTRSGTGVAANASVAVQVAGVRDGVPSVEGGLSAVAVTLTAVHNGTSGGYAKAWGDGAVEPGASVINYGPSTSIRTTTTILPVGANGKIRIKNASSTKTDFVVDLQGTYNSLPGGPALTNLTGQRRSATTLPFPITDQTSASVDAGTGNLMISTSALSMPGVTSSTQIGVSYNSRSSQLANTNTMAANRWQYALAGAGDLSANASGVVYTDGAGTAWQFTPTGEQGVFQTPAGLQQTLTRVNTSGTNYEYQLKGWTTNQVIHFNLAGQPTSVNDRNGNQVSFNRTDYALTTLVSSAGVTGARTANASYANGVQTFSQTSGSSSRTVSWTKNSDGDIVAYTDALGKQTTFGYTDRDLTSITAPEGGVTSFTYDSGDRVTKIEQANTTAGSPGTAVTRLSYASDTSTLVADPRSDQSVPVAAAKHTAYTVNSNGLVEKAVDAAGREQSREYNPSNNGVSAATTGVSGSAGASTSTGTYGANNKQSLTQVQGASGSSSTSTYSTGANAYRPADSTDSAGNSQQYTYSGVGNQLTTKSGSGDNAATATLKYDDALGFVTEATAPGNDGNPTKYTHDGSTHQLTTITAPTGTSLEPQSFTYDDFGRTKTQTDGRGDTTTTTYDNDDRPLTIVFSDGTQTVTNTYDGNGNRTQQTSAGGTITTTYDQQNRLITTQNSAGGGQVQYGYDLAGNTVSVTDAHGTVTHDYDPANALASTTYPTNSGTAKQLYRIDDHGRRTDTWLAAVANADPTKDPTSWQAHQKLTYDKSGKVTQVQAWANSAAPQPVVDTTYCFLDGVAVGAACTATDGKNDRDQLQWSKDNLTQQTTDYDYTTKNKDGSTATTTRLQKATQAGGAKNTTWTYTYDAAGNRLTATASGDTTSSQTLTFNPIGQITSAGYAYDATGNMTAAPGATFTYNGAQQLISSTKDGKKTTYAYAGADMNRLLSQSTDGGPTYRYTYGTGITSREVVGTGTASVVSDPSTGQPLDFQTNDGATSMWVLDGIGSQAAAITDTGKTAYTTTYDPYGAETVTAGGDSAQWKQNPFGFKGGVRAGDANGLTKFGMRWQTSTTGGWIERDTMDAPLDPSNANRYAYAADDPINGSDPTGRNYTQNTGTFCYYVCLSLGYADDGYGHRIPTQGFGLGAGFSASATSSNSTGSLSEGWTGGFSCTAGAGGVVTGSASSANTSPVPTDYSVGAGLGAGADCGVDFTYTGNLFR